MATVKTHNMTDANPTKPNTVDEDMFAALYRMGSQKTFIKRFMDRNGTIYDAFVEPAGEGREGWYCEFALERESAYMSVNRLRNFALAVCRHYKCADLDVVIPKFKEDWAKYASDDEALQKIRIANKRVAFKTAWKELVESA